MENNVLLKEINPNLDLSVISIIESKEKNIEEPFDFSIIKSSNKEEEDIQILIPTTTPTITPTTTPTITPTITPVTETPIITPTETLTESTP